mmetsp:Transcript_17075/g.66509  ORF Transcript_17075/g.66509 Transcript_17075/m.66509 type:complete len:303 (+) Transcript_17075:1709-2617(+)
MLLLPRESPPQQVDVLLQPRISTVFQQSKHSACLLEFSVSLQCGAFRQAQALTNGRIHTSRQPARNLAEDPMLPSQLFLRLFCERSKLLLHLRRHLGHSRRYTEGSDYAIYEAPSLLFLEGSLYQESILQFRQHELIAALVQPPHTLVMREALLLFRQESLDSLAPLALPLAAKSLNDPLCSSWAANQLCVVGVPEPKVENIRGVVSGRVVVLSEPSAVSSREEPVQLAAAGVMLRQCHRLLRQCVVVLQKRVPDLSRVCQSMDFGCHVCVLWDANCRLHHSMQGPADCLQGSPHRRARIGE